MSELSARLPSLTSTSVLNHHGNNSGGASVPLPLPDELLVAVFKELEPRQPLNPSRHWYFPAPSSDQLATLASAARVCRAWQGPAAAELYHSLSVNVWLRASPRSTLTSYAGEEEPRHQDDAAQGSTPRGLQLLRTLRSSPGLGRLVHSLEWNEIDWTGFEISGDPQRSAGAPPPGTQRSISAIFHLCPRLVALDLRMNDLDGLDEVFTSSDLSLHVEQLRIQWHNGDDEADSWRLLGRLLRHCSYLKVLEVPQELQVGHDEIRALDNALAVACFPHVQALYLPDSHPTYPDDGGSYLGVLEDMTTQHLEVFTSRVGQALRHLHLAYGIVDAVYDLAGLTGLESLSLDLRPHPSINVVVDTLASLPPTTSAVSIEQPFTTHHNYLDAIPSTVTLLTFLSAAVDSPSPYAHPELLLPSLLTMLSSNRLPRLRQIVVEYLDNVPPRHHTDAQQLEHACRRVGVHLEGGSARHWRRHGGTVDVTASMLQEGTLGELLCSRSPAAGV